MTPFIDDELFAAQFLEPDHISLSSEQIRWAARLSQWATPETEQWQAYLSLLALLGLQKWLQKRLPELPLKSNWLPNSQCSQAAGTLSAMQAACLSQLVSCVEVGTAKLYLLTAALDDPEVALPQRIDPVIDFMPDFYVLVEVLEELAQIRICGYLPLQLAKQAVLPVSERATESKTAWIPAHTFSPDPDELLLHLHRLHRSEAASALRTPEQAALLSLPDPVINAGLWLKNQLNQAAASLDWMLLPPLNLSSAMMGGAPMPVEDLDAVITELIRHRGLVIPPQARAAYQDLQLGRVSMRLYALVWSIDAASPTPEWSLLLILGAPSGTQLPVGTRLRVEDESQILAEEMLSQAPYLYAQMIGTWNEQFRITVTLPDGTAIAPLPFVFQPDGQPSSVS